MAETFRAVLLEDSRAVLMVADEGVVGRVL